MAGSPGACQAGAGRRGPEWRPRRGRAGAPYGGARAGRGADPELSPAGLRQAEAVAAALAARGTV
ncbi:bifunctional RNase H/acid phosphatase, partial [Streptomyces fradiae]